MKKHLILAISVVAMVVACSKSGTKTDFHESDEPMPIRFGTNILTATVKSVGSVDLWNNHEVRVFGYDKTITDFAAAKNSPDDIENMRMLDDVPLVIPADKGEDLLAVLKEGTDAPYYYFGDSRYDFYGYYIDDAERGEPLYGVGNISFPLTINGKQDIMFAWANPAVDAVDKVENNQAYSSYSARRGVNPTLRFEHVLSQFVFRVEIGENSTSGENVTIEELSLNGYNHGIFTAVGETDAKKVFVPDETQEKVKLYLNEYETTGALIPLEFGATATSQTMGHLMMMPASEYQLEIKVKQDNIGEYTYWDKTINLTSDGTKPFEPGYRYFVDIKVYGREQINVKVTLEPWELYPGDPVEIDPDKPITWQ